MGALQDQNSVFGGKHVLAKDSTFLGGLMEIMSANYPDKNPSKPPISLGLSTAGSSLFKMTTHYHMPRAGHSILPDCCWLYRLHRGVMG